MSDFQERFRSHTNAQLLHVLQNRKQYQYAAIKAAEDELNSRNLTDAALKEAQAQLRDAEVQKAAEKQKREQAGKKFQAAGESASNEVLNFARSRRSKVDKGIIVLSIVFALEFLWTLQAYGDLLVFMFTNYTARWDLATLAYFFPLVLLPPAVILFFLKKRVGWFLLMFHICISLVTVFVGLAISGLPFGTWLTPLGSMLFGVIFYGVTAYYVSTAKVREQFSVMRQSLILTCVIASALAGYLWYAVINGL